MRQLLIDCKVYGTNRAVALEIYLYSNRHGAAVLKCDSIRQAIRNSRGQPVNGKTIRRAAKVLESTNVLTKRICRQQDMSTKLNIDNSKMAGLDAKMSGPNMGSLYEPAASSANIQHDAPGEHPAL